MPDFLSNSLCLPNVGLSPRVSPAAPLSIRVETFYALFSAPPRHYHDGSATTARAGATSRANPPVAAGGEKRARSLTRRPRIGVGVGAGGSSKRSTTPTPQRLSFSRPSAAATAAIPSSSSSSSSSPPRNISNSSGGGGGASAGSAAKFSYGKPLTDLPSAPPNAPLPRPPTDKKKSSTIASSSNSNSRSNSSNNSNNGGNTTISTKDWLADTETQLRQDLETTKKELELIRTILWEIEMDDSSSSPPAPSSPSSSSGIGSPPPPATSSSPPTAEGKAAAAGGTQQQQKSQRKMLMAACREYAESRRQLLRERLRQVQFWAGSRAMGRRVPSTAPLDWGAGGRGVDEVVGGPGGGGDAATATITAAEEGFVDDD
ncbi:hypothetical protein PG995_014447 [Apiospora arundinis]